MQTGKVWFIGAGSGDPELLTVTGRRLIETADQAVYAGSLVPQAIVELARLPGDTPVSRTGSAGRMSTWHGQQRHSWRQQWKDWGLHARRFFWCCRDSMPKTPGTVPAFAHGWRDTNL